jgi:hypothetical protein
MQLAVQAFGMPEPQVDGDTTPYHPWKTVSAHIMAKVDAAEEDYGFTTLIFSLLDSMDAEFPRRRHSLLWHAGRLFLTPLRRKLPAVRPTQKNESPGT